VVLPPPLRPHDDGFPGKTCEFSVFREKGIFRLPLQAAHEVFAGKEVKFFSKAFENKRVVVHSSR
jgi:hypothetical protein